LSNAQITIAVPSFNQGRFLNDTLASIFEQDLPVEVYVMDGGSSDNSLDIIRQWDPKLAGWRSHTDDGQAAAINEGMDRGSAPYVCWLSSDDFLYPDGLNKLLQTLQKSPESPFAYGYCWAVSESGRKISPYLTLPFSPRIFANFCIIAQPATLITRSAWKHVGGLDGNMQLAFDYDLWWRLFKAYGKPEFCRHFVAATRMHKDTKTATQTELHYRESIDVVKRNWGAVPIKWRAALPVMKMIRKSNK
jgi:glycosyltransferase involved in cell wall biosynthesis